MTALAERFDRVIAVDVSPGCSSGPGRRVSPAVDFRAVPGDDLAPVEDAIADVPRLLSRLQHLPERRIVLALPRGVRARWHRPGARSSSSRHSNAACARPRGAWRATSPFLTFASTVASRTRHRGTR
jgi:hypothetical protein